MYKLLALATSVFAAWQDEKCHKVSGRLLALSLACSLTARFVMILEGIEEVQSLFLCVLPGMAVPAVILWWFFRKKAMGAADVKLLIVLGSIMGPGRVLDCMLRACIAGLMVYSLRYANGNTGREMPFALPVLISVLMWTMSMY